MSTIQKYHILAILGSLRKESSNRKLLNEIIKIAPTEIKFEIYDWAAIPIFNQDAELDLPQPVKDFKAHVSAADGILVVSPEYNAGMPGGVKNLIDWGTRPWGTTCWAGKPVAIIGNSGRGGMNASRNYYESFKLVRANSITIPQNEVPISSNDITFDEKGAVKEEIKQKALRYLKSLQELIDKARVEATTNNVK